MIAAGATVLSAGLAPGRLLAGEEDRDDDRTPITKGDIAILRFLQALEAIETDLWLQYSELGGTQDNEVHASSQGLCDWVIGTISFCRSSAPAWLTAMKRSMFVCPVQNANPERE